MVDVEPKTVDETVRIWVEEIDLAREREREWRKDGAEAQDLYEAKNQPASFNVVYSNTETLAPSLYGAMPRPVVQRRFKDDDPLGKAAAAAGQRVLEFLLDTNSEEYETFDESMKDAVLDALLPGRGVTEWCYHAETSDYQGSSRLVAESVYPKTVVWNRFYHGFAKRWPDVPWCAVEIYLDKDAVQKEFGKPIADKMQYSYEGSENRDKKEENKPVEERTKTKTACIYKIWDKKKRQIVWVSPNHPTSLLRTDDDELNLTGFYPFPRPLRFLRKANNLMPTALYKLYKAQAKELNTISKRLIHLIAACKVRGVYDSTIGEIEEVLKSEENSLIPATNVAALQTTKGIEGAIWLLPIDNIIKVIKELYVAREQCKQVIYEITGISDIIRGQTSPTETLGAQKIKEQWITLRLKNMQKEVQRYVRDSLRIILEIAAQRFQPTTWDAMTGLPYNTPEEQARIEMIAKGTLADAVVKGQPPQLPPEVQQQLSAPQWVQVIQVLRDDLTRQYKIDIESNSTLDVEANEDKELVAELMNAIAQFLNGIAPLVEQGILPFQAAQAMLLAVTKKFRFGEDIEEHIKAMQPPQPRDDGKGAEVAMKAKAEADRLALDREVEGAKLQESQAGRAEKANAEREKLAMERQNKIMEIAAQERADERKIAAEREARLAELAAERETEKYKANLQKEVELEKARIAAAAQIQVAERTSQAETENANTQAKAQTSQVKAQAEVMPDLAGMVKSLMDGQMKLMEMISSEKELVRDGNGKISGVRLKKKAVASAKPSKEESKPPTVQ